MAASVTEGRASIPQRLPRASAAAPAAFARRGVTDVTGPRPAAPTLRATPPGHVLDWPELRILLKALLLPPASPLCLAVLGLALAFLRPRAVRIAGRVLLAVGLVLAWLTSTWAMADRMFAALEAGQRPLDAETLKRALEGPDPPRAVVVVSMGARRDGLHMREGERLLTRSTERAVAAAQVAKRAGLPLYVQGYGEKDLLRSSAEQMARLMRDDMGAQILHVDDALPGIGHAEIGRRVATVLAKDGITSVILSTHAHNMPRLRPALEAAGLKVLPAPHTFRAADLAGPVAWVPQADAVEANGIAFYEWIGRLSYRLPGRALEPAPQGVRKDGHP